MRSTIFDLVVLIYRILVGSFYNCFKQPQVRNLLVSQTIMSNSPSIVQRTLRTLVLTDIKLSLFQYILNTNILRKKYINIQFYTHGYDRIRNCDQLKTFSKDFLLVCIYVFKSLLLTIHKLENETKSILYFEQDSRTKEHTINSVRSFDCECLLKHHYGLRDIQLYSIKANVISIPICWFSYSNQVFGLKHRCIIIFKNLFRIPPFQLE